LVMAEEGREEDDVAGVDCELGVKALVAPAARRAMNVPFFSIIVGRVCESTIYDRLIN